MRLSELSGNGKIMGFSEDFVSKRLFAMGCRPGNYVEFILSKGNLCEYRIGETLIAVNISGADGISVE